MSLYYIQKHLFNFNNDHEYRDRYEKESIDVLSRDLLTDDELKALAEKDIGLLHVLGVNRQILMNYAIRLGYDDDQFVQALNDGIEKYGPIRDSNYNL